jgi:hypothetical protein
MHRVTYRRSGDLRENSTGLSLLAKGFVCVLCVSLSIKIETWNFKIVSQFILLNSVNLIKP